MDDTIKLIIEMSEGRYNEITNKAKYICPTGLERVIANGTPLDSVKAEIAKPIQEECYYIGEAKIQADTIKWCLDILNNIGKAEKGGE